MPPTLRRPFISAVGRKNNSLESACWPKVQKDRRQTLGQNYQCSSADIDRSGPSVVQLDLVCGALDPMVQRSVLLSVLQAGDTAAAVCIGPDIHVTACRSPGRRENRWNFGRLR